MIPNLSKEMIDLMQQLRKRIRSEFGVDLRLSQPDVVERLLELVNKSHDQKTLLLFADLEDMMGISFEHPTQEKQESSDQHETIIRRVYRGQVIEERPARNESQAKSASGKRIYRGQVVA
ncbi:hypothetical protein HF888_13250 [Bermanella marisrubri]|uniref:Uncharacterized protein n=1 Tax=Bermanella marisrubri TaxID=207949 RepID=Q1N336_9GAMM|nr:hypothetical protein [Bermanella marisrubri]EAT12755.1 hypothetical protein RED65_13762 [Oceanobacter sp. RED65] [Bermanella marisrubri]QIZ85129.1 hypothetical protein HF888_13250 [Bermanella marisrubri]